MHKRGRAHHQGRQRSNTKRFPYEPILVAGKLVMPAELQRIHHIVLDTAVIESVSDEVRAVVERLWPELVTKLPRRPATRDSQ
jgi:hypothetical protein